MEPDIRVRNAAAADLHRPVSLERGVRLPPRAIYEPEMFSGAVCRLPEPKRMILPFAGGKLACAGAGSGRRPAGAYISCTTWWSG